MELPGWMGGGRKALLTHSVSASEAVNEMTGVIYCLVNIPQAVEAIVCPPFVSPDSFFWQYCYSQYNSHKIHYGLDR